MNPTPVMFSEFEVASQKLISKKSSLKYFKYLLKYLKYIPFSIANLGLSLQNHEINFLTGNS